MALAPLLQQPLLQKLGAAAPVLAHEPAEGRSEVGELHSEQAPGQGLLRARMALLRWVAQCAY